MVRVRDRTKISSESPERRRADKYLPNVASRQHSLQNLQRLAGNRAVVNLLESSGQAQTKLHTGEPSDEFEQEADLMGELIQRNAKSPARLSSTVPHIQRAPRDGDSTATSEAEKEAEPATGRGPLIVEDDAVTMAPGQMRKSEFLEQLRSAVCTSADEALAEAGQSTEGCPYIEQWLGYYADREPAHIERALRKYAPEAAAATSARDYIPAVGNRVRRGVETWAKTGEITGVPDELKDMLTGPGAALGAIGGMLGSIGSAIGGAITAVAGAIGGAFSSIGKALFKRKEGAGEARDEPHEIQAQLSGGQALAGPSKSRMGAAFGQDFSGVRVHTGAQAAGLSEQLNARAFTIGNDIAFGAGEYQPGTLVGDALIAHELAHVVQQGNGNGSSSPQSKGSGGEGALEADADMAAVGAVVSAWGGVPGAIREIGRSAMPRLKSGLKLQSCGPKPDPQTPYEKLVVEGTEKLQDPRFGFGFPWVLVGEDCDSSKNPKDQKFDSRYWKTAKAGPKECMLVNVGKASAAIDALFDKQNRSKWEIDCRIFSELPHWYAMLHTLGPKKFDERFPTIELRRADLPGLQTTAYWFEATANGGQLIEAEVRQDTKHGPVTQQVRDRPEPVAKEGAQPMAEADVVARVPVGSRVTFGVYPIAEGYPPHKDNTVKMGNDVYAAHDVPVGTDALYTREKLVEALRTKYDPYGSIPAKNFRIVAIEVYDVAAMTK